VGHTRQLVAAEHAELLNGYDANVVFHKFIVTNNLQLSNSTHLVVSLLDSSCLISLMVSGLIFGRPWHLPQARLGDPISDSLGDEPLNSAMALITVNMPMGELVSICSVIGMRSMPR
jgi:hypothetical protein